jgi:membrane protein YqaA with SNARE-associated domain
MEGVIAAARWFPEKLRQLYDWVLSWADRPNAGLALFMLAFAESSFFPIPPDVLLIALALSRPDRAFRWAFIALAGSVAGGVAGYGLGYFFMETVGSRILDFYHLQEQYRSVQGMYHQYDAWAVAAGGFTPLPYKLFTITAGAFRLDLLTFFIASVISRAGRFFLVAGAIYFFGPAVKNFLDRYFNICTIIFTVLLIGGFFAIKFLV